MNDSSKFDAAVAHRFFSADCYNRAWELIEKSTRTPEEDDQMRNLCHASLWHWTQRGDCTARTLSVGYWQLARVYALLGRADDAARYGGLCLRYSERESPFYAGYAHEALARAARAGGHDESCARHLEEARRLAAQVIDKEERAMLEKDLDTIL